jgi:Ca2+-binding RTX toxin-like protein
MPALAAEIATPPGGLIVSAVPWPLSVSELGATKTTVLCGVDQSNRSYRLTPPSAGVLQVEPSWSPDGTGLAFATIFEAGPGAGGDADVVVDQMGSPSRFIGSVSHAEWPAWSPNGTWLAFQSPSSSNGAADWSIIVATPKGTSPRRVVSGRGPITWSPDSSQLAIASDDGIVIVRLDGTVERRILPGTRVTSLDWSPDGRRFVFTSAPLPAQLELVMTDGSDRHVVHAGLNGAAPVWSPDGSRIAYEAASGIGTVAADGTAPISLPAGGGATVEGPGSIDWQPVARPEMLRMLPPCWIKGDATHHDLVGSRFADQILGTSGADKISGGAGDDVIDAVGGADQIAGGSGSDQIASGAGADAIEGGSGRDTILGGMGNDTINGGSGNDLLRGDQGNDRITGAPGRDTIFGGTGDDTIYARDSYRDSINCGPGLDIVYADKLDRVAKDCERVLRAGS